MELLLCLPSNIALQLCEVLLRESVTINILIAMDTLLKSNRYCRRLDWVRWKQRNLRNELVKPFLEASNKYQLLDLVSVITFWNGAFRIIYKHKLEYLFDFVLNDYKFLDYLVKQIPKYAFEPESFVRMLEYLERKEITPAISHSWNPDFGNYFRVRLEARGNGSRSEKMPVGMPLIMIAVRKNYIDLSEIITYQICANGYNPDKSTDIYPQLLPFLINLDDHSHAEYRHKLIKRILLSKPELLLDYVLLAIYKDDTDPCEYFDLFDQKIIQRITHEVRRVTQDFQDIPTARVSGLKSVIHFYPRI